MSATPLTAGTDYQYMTISSDTAEGLALIQWLELDAAQRSSGSSGNVGSVQPLVAPNGSEFAGAMASDQCRPSHQRRQHVAGYLWHAGPGHQCAPRVGSGDHGKWHNRGGSRLGRPIDPPRPRGKSGVAICLQRHHWSDRDPPAVNRSEHLRMPPMGRRWQA